MTTRPNNNARTRTAVPCHACGRRSVAPGNLLHTVPHDLIEQTRKAAAGLVPPAQLDRLLPQILSALETYEKENEWLSEQVDLGDIDAKKYREQLDAADMKGRTEAARAAGFASFVERFRTMAWLHSRSVPYLAQALDQAAHWDPIGDESPDRTTRVNAFVAALPPCTFMVTDAVEVDLPEKKGAH